MPDLLGILAGDHLVVAPRKVVIHMNALKHGVASKNALIAAGLAVQAEMGPPLPGTHRHRFHGDETPRIDLGDNPGHPRRQGRVVPDEDRAVAALLRMPEGQLHNMSRLPKWLHEVLAASVKPGRSAT